MTRHHLKGVAFGLAVVAAIVVIVVAIRSHNAWERWCTDHPGAHVDRHTDWISVPDGNGGTTTSTNTTYYCISDDGRILGIR